MIGYCGKLKQEIITEADCFYCKEREQGYTCLFWHDKVPVNNKNNED